jgi:DNA-nicking Smr family endonuclease
LQRQALVLLTHMQQRLRQIKKTAAETALKTAPAVLAQTDGRTLFAQAVKDVRPLPANQRTVHATVKPKPLPRTRVNYERDALADNLSDHFIPVFELETDAALAYLAHGHAPDILRKLGRKHWPIEAAIDLHGMISDDARQYVATFISDCKQRGIRCVRIVHGKGLSSRNQAPVLKNRLRSWLMQLEVVIAYVAARKQDGGDGAVIVLLKA